MRQVIPAGGQRQGGLSQTLLDAATGTGAGTTQGFNGPKATVQASSDGSHTGTSTIDIEVSNDGALWIVAGTLSVTGNSDTDGFVMDAPWRNIRANVTAHGDSTNGVSVTVGV